MLEYEFSISKVPIVIMWDSEKVPSQYLFNNAVFPTPESPIVTIFTVWTRGLAGFWFIKEGARRIEGGSSD